MPVLFDLQFDSPDADDWSSEGWTNTNEYGGASTDIAGGGGRLILPANLVGPYAAATYERHGGNFFGGAGVLEGKLRIPTLDYDVMIECEFFASATFRTSSYLFQVEPSSQGNQAKFGYWNDSGVSTQLALKTNVNWRGKDVRFKLLKVSTASGGLIKFKAWEHGTVEPAAWMYEGNPTYSPPDTKHMRFGISQLEDTTGPTPYVAEVRWLNLRTFAGDTLPMYVVGTNGAVKGPLDTYYVKPDGSTG